MPRLPSGRHVGLDPAPLDALLKDIDSRTFLNELLVIERREQLYAYVDVLYLEPAADGDPVAFAPGSVPAPANLVPRPSGFTIASIGPELGSWPLGDRRAFAEFLESDRAARFLDDELQRVMHKKRQLALHGSLTVRTQAALWMAGLHPLQAGSSDDDELSQPELRVVGKTPPPAGPEET